MPGGHPSGDPEIPSDNNDIEDYYELIGDMISDLRFSMRQHPDMFTNEEKLRYADFIEE